MRLPQLSAGSLHSLTLLEVEAALRIKPGTFFPERYLLSTALFDPQFLSQYQFALVCLNIARKFVQFLGFAITAWLGSLGSDGPPLLTAITRNSYSSPSVRFGTVAVVASPGTVSAGSHLNSHF